MEGTSVPGPTAYRGKRARSLSSSSSSGSEDVDAAMSPGSPTTMEYHASRAAGSPSKSSRPSKFHRTPEEAGEFLCTLPPTCSQPGTSQHFGSQGELEAHQARVHRWMCRVPIRDKPGRVGEGEAVLMPEQFSGRSAGRGQRWRECGKVFPDERFLDLHYTETHDPIAREKLQRGEKIFECFLPPDQCRKVCLTPKKRRHHLIDKHGYPVNYFFAITNHGLNRMVRTEGAGASLIRPRRDPPKAEDGDQAGSPTHTRLRSPTHPSHPHSGHRPPPTQHHAPPHPPDEMDIDDLTLRMNKLESSLAFVPRNVRRGAARRQTSRAAAMGD